MSYTLKITARAEKSYTQNLDYLEKEWGGKVTLQFMERVDSVLQAIRQNPYLYPIFSPSQKIRRCVIQGRIIMYYRISGKTRISILLFWNTYQNPDKLRF
jgi:plasmid stabilization system protein ParE